MRTLKNINPIGQVDVPVLRRQGEPFGEQGRGCLEPGEVVTVEDDIAGEAPHWRLATDDDVLEHFESRVVESDAEPEVNENGDPVPVEPTYEILDPGHGLLAQTDNFIEVKGDDPTKGLNLEELKDLAGRLNVDLGDATTKADIAELIRKAV